jgi:hypothetical protein
VLNQLARIETPGWDHNVVHQAIDLPRYLERMADQADRAHAAGHASYNRCGMFDKLAASMRAMKNTWSFDLSRPGPASILQMPNRGPSEDGEVPTAAAGRNRGGQEEEVVVEEGGGGESTTGVDVNFDPVWMDFTDDTWLTDILSSWDRGARDS